MYPTSTIRMRIHATRCSRFMACSLRGQSAGKFEEPPHARVPEVGAGSEHHRAGTSDHADVMLTAVVDGAWRDTRRLLPHGLMHPYTANAGIAAVVHDLLRDLRSRDNHHAINAARDGFEVGIAAIAFEGLHVRVHREDVVPGRLQPLVDQIADRVVA